MSLPSVLDVLAALFTADREPNPEPALEHYGPCDRAVPEPEAGP